jgi:hypothetical protein
MVELFKIVRCSMLAPTDCLLLLLQVLQAMVDNNVHLQQQLREALLSVDSLAQHNAALQVATDVS